MLTMAFNQEKALVGAFSVIVQLCRLIVNSSNPGGGCPRIEVGALLHQRAHREPEAVGQREVVLDNEA